MIYGYDEFDHMLETQELELVSKQGLLRHVHVFIDRKTGRMRYFFEVSGREGFCGLMARRRSKKEPPKLKEFKSLKGITGCFKRFLEISYDNGVMAELTIEISDWVDYETPSL